MSSVRIRRYAPAHAVPLNEAALESVAEVGPWLPWCHRGHTLDEAESYIRQQRERFERGEEYSFAIESEDGRLLGGCGLNELDQSNRRCNLGYWVRSSETGRGHATQAVLQLASWAFSHTDLVRLEIVASVENKPSQRVAERVMSVREGVLRRRLLLHGRWHDAVSYSIIRPDVT